MKPAALAAIGVVVIVAIGATLGLGMTGAADRTGGVSTTGGNGFCADMSDAVGLYVGNPVTQMGLQVGTVSRIDNAGDHVRITFDLDDGRAYPADVQAVTRSKSLLADRSLELVGNYTSGPTLEQGRCIDRKHSHTPKSISEVTGSASDFIKNLTDADSGDVGGTIAGLDKALAGTGPDAANMFRHAAAASADPDQFIADIGASIANMAPLTDNALRQWDQIMSILNQMPSIAGLGTELFGFVSKFDRGVGWTVATIYDIQRNYGSILWPLVHGPVKDLISLAAARAPDLQKLYGTVPAVSAALRQQTNAAGGLSVPYRAPGVQVSAAQCRALGPACSTTGRTNTVNLFSLIVQKAGVR
ncbi:Mce family protein [Gordonia soli NBRC 108243]|uniref:Mce family protein n=2 Tax=Gordonia soli TaxID=320799 RepID=M0QIW7_9ACTN|nr:Mce family protein [Gordonia soli NBRC 108243]